MLKQCQENNLAHILVNAAKPEEWETVLQLARTNNVHAALGLHPFFVDQWTPALIHKLEATLKNAPEDASVVAIGEIGLDAWNGRENLDVQLEAFTQQLLLAQRLNLPVALHNRKTWQDFFNVLKELKITTLKGYCHHFTGSQDVLKKILDLGLLVSFCGPATHPNARKIHQAIKYAPIDAILTETDCPDLPPVQSGESQSRPWHVLHVLQTIADIKKIHVQQLAEHVQQNFSRLFLKN